MEGRERGQIRRFIAFILSVFMVVGIVNVPRGVVNAEEDDYYVITFDGNGVVDYQEYDYELQDYVINSSEKRWVYKGDSIGWIGNDHNERDRYIFLGYKLENSDTLYVTEDSDYYVLKEGEEFISDYVPTGDVTFYAVGVDACNITYDANGGYFTDKWDSESQKYIPDYSPIIKKSAKENAIGRISPEYATREGYRFIGFKVENSDTLYVTENSDYYVLKEGEEFISDYVPTGDVTFYAQWVETCKVTFDANGGWLDEEWNEETREYEPSKETVTLSFLKGVKLEDDSYNYTRSPYERDGYIFTGYKIKDSDILYVIQDRDDYELKEGEEFLDDYVPTEDVTFVAQWDEAYVVTYDGNGGYYGTIWYYDTEESAPICTEKRNVKKGSKIGDNLREPYERVGYLFKGYKTENSETLYVSYGSDYCDLDEEPLSEYEPTEDTTFYAQWEETYVVTLDGNGGYYNTRWDYESQESVPDYTPVKINVRKGSNFGDEYRYKPHEREGYVFLGYRVEGSDTLYVTDYSYDYSDYEGEVIHLFDYVPTEDVTFIAQWAEAYVVTYDGKGGYYDTKWDYETEESIPDYTPVTRNVIKGSKINYKWERPYSRPGYEFIGYKMEGDNTLYVTYDSDDYELNDGEAFLSEYEPTENVTFYAEWVDTYTVTFEGNGGWFNTRWDEESQEYIPDYSSEKFEIKKNDIIGYCPEPQERVGYIFKGYKIENSNTLYVTYDSDYYELKTGEAFLSDYVVTEDVTFIAQWEKTYVVTFDGNGGWYDTKWDYENQQSIPDYTPKKISVEKGSTLEYRCYYPHERYGYNFTGYKTKDSDTLYVTESRRYYDLKDGEAFFEEYTPTKDVTFYAQWEEARILDIKLDPKGGHFFSEKTGEKDYDVHDIKDYYPIYNGYQPGQKISLSVKCRKEGMVFTGWKSGVDGTVYKPGDPVTFTDDETFTAQYKDGTVIVLNPNGGYYYYDNYDLWRDDKYIGEPWLVASENGKISIDMKFGTDEEGMAFAGWKRDGDDTLYSSEDLENMTFTDDETFYAQWTDSYKVTFYSEEGYMKNDRSKKKCTIYVAKDSKFYGLLPITRDDARTRDGYYVDYWTLDEDDTEYHDSDIQGMVIDRDMTFTAHWKEAPVITYKANGGTVFNYGTPYSNEYREYKGVGAKLTERRTYRDGYDQTGWLVEDESPLNGSIITDLTTYVVGGDATFIAQWKIKNPDGKCAVKFDYDGATIVYNGEEYAGSDYESETYFEQGKKLNTDQLYGETWFDSVVKENYILKGWMVVGAEDETIYDNPRDIVCDSDMTVKAVFIQDCSKLGHEEEEVAAVEPTCTEKGHKAGKRCSVCGETLEGLEEIPALEHNYVEVENTAVEPTCTKAGKEADKKCSRCEDVIIGKTIKATGHNMTAHSAVTATCETEGNSAYWSCDKCDKFFSDKDGKNEIDENSWIIPAAGHKYGKLIAESPAKCTVDGVKAHYECSVCKKLFVYEGDDYTETTEAALKIAAPGHEEEEVSELDPTCDTAGHKAGKKCSVCGEALEGMEVIPALGHEWDEGEVTTEPTCSMQGVRTYHCTREGCNKTKTETIAKKAHTIVIDPAVEATTEKTGLTEGSHCSVCRTIIKRQQVIPKKEDPNKKAEEEAKKKAEEEAKKKAEEEAKKKAEEEAKKKAAENAKTSYSNEWVEGKWYDENGKQNYSGTLLWKSDATGWWVEDTDGWYPKDSWQKIDGIWYYFKPNGYMAMGEYYYGYWFNKDGSWDPAYKLSWKSNETGWWVEDISGWWPSNTWLKIDGNWYYFNGSGYMVTNQYVDGWWIGSDGVCR